MTTSRESILEAARSALADQPPLPVVPRDYRRATEAPPDAATRFAERVADFRAEVRLVASSAVASVVRDALAALGARSVVVPAGVPEYWLPDGLPGLLCDNPHLASAALDAIDAVITGCALAIAETGTVVLDGGPGQGRRALSLVPDRHVCIVPASAIVDDVPAAVAALDPHRPLTWISGPSATSDIELDRVEGVHGPRQLIVIVVLDAPESPAAPGQAPA